MTNIEVKQDGNKLILTIDVTKTSGASKSGKSVIVATTSGNVKLPCGVTLGLNCYKPA